MKIKENVFEKIEEILDNSYNYDLIRRLAVNIYNTNNLIVGISEKCRIIFNPNRHFLILYKNDIGNEKFFDIEFFDELELSEAIKFKKSFVKAFEQIYNSNRLLNI